jgi:hypothetical protein
MIPPLSEPRGTCEGCGEPIYQDLLTTPNETWHVACALRAIGVGEPCERCGRAQRLNVCPECRWRTATCLHNDDTGTVRELCRACRERNN